LVIRSVSFIEPKHRGTPTPLNWRWWHSLSLKLTVQRVILYFNQAMDKVQMESQGDRQWWLLLLWSVVVVLVIIFISVVIIIIIICNLSTVASNKWNSDMTTTWFCYHQRVSPYVKLECILMLHYLHITLSMRATVKLQVYVRQAGFESSLQNFLFVN
jgi:hypothetical protein